MIALIETSNSDEEYWVTKTKKSGKRPGKKTQRKKSNGEMKLKIKGR